MVSAFRCVSGVIEPPSGDCQSIYLIVRIVGVEVLGLGLTAFIPYVQPIEVRKEKN